MIRSDLEIGFTGTQFGMTEHQIRAVKTLVERLQPIKWHHGDCIGADAQSHDIVREVATQTRRKIEIAIHPPEDDRKRAFKKGDELRSVAEYLERNRDIVDETSILIATPKSIREELRSGTWYTIRYARREKKGLIIVYPTGACEVESTRNEGNC